MPALLLVVFLLQLSVPKGRPDAEIGAVRRRIGRRSFQQQLLRAAQAVFRLHPELARIRLNLSR